MSLYEIITLGGTIVTNIYIDMEDSKIVNQSHEFSFMLFSIPVCVLTLLVNMGVVKVFWKEKKAIVNQLMILDSIVNMVYSSLGTFQQTPYYRGLGLQFVCYPHMMVSFANITFKQLLPVSIVVFRYHH